ncbi:MAG: peptidoglycan bridge formation glycyltransferase FemA/FemB family protein [Candidatus Magasanikbacteria bacterium]|nr:peptidoglycan bridge formation glycyltransferase FemA/FemB family protein [Candidatus Magasanikbacteria bacterium]
MFAVNEITDKELWERFVLEQKYALFPQSFKYGEFYQTLGEGSWIFGVFDGDNLIGGSLAVSVHAKRGNFLLLPYGPIAKEDKHQGAVLGALTAHLAGFAKKHGMDFIKVSPFWQNDQTHSDIFREFRYKNSPLHILAENTWLLDLSPSEDNLLKGTQKNHRYLIRRCAKEGIKVTKTSNPEELDEFNRLHDITARKHSFHRFSDSYIKSEFERFAKQKEAVLFKAFLPDGRLDSAAIIIYYGNMAAYRHGASANLDTRLPTSYLVQWEAIKEAKNRGMKWHNFWGIAPPKASKKHPFYGITHFKKGFGGFGFDLVHCQDMPLTKKYYLNWVVEKMRSIKRGFSKQ